MSKAGQAESTREYTEADKNALIRIRNQVDTIEALSLRYFFDETAKTLDAKVKFLEENLRPLIDKIKVETELTCEDLGKETCEDGECAYVCSFSMPEQGPIN